MRAMYTSLGSASALIVLTVLLSGASADTVTTRLCRRGTGWRVRQDPDTNATKIVLANCDLHHFNENDILGLPNITRIDLSYNDIFFRDLSAFRHVPMLQTLSVGNNDLRFLPVFPEHSCPKLINLYLHYNSLTSLDDAETFSACAQLKVLSLEHNRIDYIHQDIFNSLPELEWLSLARNKIPLITDQMFAHNKKLRLLKLYDNRLTYISQDLASSFKRAGGGLDTFYFHRNPWQCNCLLGLLADVKRAGVRDYGNWTSYPFAYSDKVCVFVGAVPCFRIWETPHPPLAHEAGLAVARALAATMDRIDFS